MTATALGAFGPGTAAAQNGPGFAGPYLAAQQAAERGDVREASRYYTEALSRDSGNTYLLEQAMLYKVAAGEMGDSVALARRLQAVEPGHHLGVLVLAADGLNRGDYAEVRDLLDAGTGSGGTFVGQIMDAWAAFGDGDADLAVSLLADIEAADNNGLPGQIVAAYHIGLVESARGDNAAAIEAFDRAAELANGGTLRLARLRAGALARLGEPERAVAVIEDRLAGTFGDTRLTRLAADIAAGAKPDPLVTEAREGAAEVLYGVSGLLSRSRNRLIALAYSRVAAFLDPELIEARLLIAEVLDQDGQYALAVEAYDTIPQDLPESLNARIGRAEALQNLGEVDAAIEALRSTTRARPGQIEAHTALADMLRREERFAESGAAYDDAVALIDTVEPHHWPLFYQRGIAFERSKQWGRAEADFKTALDLSPDQPLVLNYLGYSWVEQGIHLDEAEKMIERAVAQRPDDGYIVDSLGWVLYRMGEFDRALGHLERAVELRPVDPVINDHYGDALWMVGRKTEARFQWRRSLSFEPEDKDAERIRRKLKAGLDIVLAEEEAAGNPAILGRSAPETVEEDDAADRDGG